MNIPELLSEDHTQKVVVFYGGRFQPMQKGHYKVYKFLADKFGTDNIFIATMFGKKQQAMHDENNYSSTTTPTMYDTKLWKAHGR